MISGLTRFPAFHHVEQLAHINRHQVFYHAEHIYLDGGGVEHRITAPSEWLSMVLTMLRFSGDWSRALGYCLPTFRFGGSPRQSATITTPARSRSVEIRHLESWLIMAATNGSRTALASQS